MPPEFNPSFKPPEWGWWVALYFFLGGITGGVLFAGSLLDLVGDRRDRGVVRLAHLLALPLILVSAALLIVDLGRPERFWHMIFQSERFPLPMLKIWSPMSLGSQILGLFGLVAFISFLDALLTRGRERRVHDGKNVLGKIVSVLGVISGLALAAYTGVLVNVGNEPVWGTSPWLGALFLFSGVSTGLATLTLLARRVPHSTVDKLEEADNYMMGLELFTLIVFLVSLGAVGARFILQSPAETFLFGIVIVLGLLAPLALRVWPRLAGGARATSTVAAILVLVGGFVLRWAVLAAPQGIGL